MSEIRVPGGNMADVLRAISDLERDHAVVVVRVDNHDAVLEKLESGQTYMTRLIISTLITVLVGVLLAAFGIVLAL